MKISSWTAVIIVVAAGPVLGQTQSIPPSRIDLSGKWTLDTYLSDHPQQVAAAIRIDLGQASERSSGGGTEAGRFGRGEGGRRGQGSSPRGGSTRANELSNEEQTRLDELTAAVRYPPTVLTISQTASAVTFTDEQGRALTFMTDGKKEKTTLGGSQLETTTKWEGPLLVSDRDLGKGRKMTSTYSIVPTTKQLLVRVEFERSPGQPGPFEIKQVYNRVASP
jgi:hypothetical protein